MLADEICVPTISSPSVLGFLIRQPPSASRRICQLVATTSLTTIDVCVVKIGRRVLNRRWKVERRGSKIVEGNLFAFEREGVCEGIDIREGRKCSSSLHLQ